MASYLLHAFTAAAADAFTAGRRFLCCIIRPQSRCFFLSFTSFISLVLLLLPESNIYQAAATFDCCCGLHKSIDPRVAVITIVVIKSYCRSTNVDAAHVIQQPTWAAVRFIIFAPLSLSVCLSVWLLLENWFLHRENKNTNGELRIQEQWGIFHALSLYIQIYVHDHLSRRAGNKGPR